MELHVEQGAEAFSFWTHGIGVLFAVVGLIWLLIQVDGAKAATALAIYGGSLIVLFSASTAHHAIQTAAGEERSGLMRRLDHVSIYVFIAGTYTPVSLLSLPTKWGWSIFGVVWGVALVGSALKLFAPFMPRWATTVAYVVMGWIAVIGIKPLLEAFTTTALLWLLAGGLVYTVGAVGYALKKPDLWPRWVGFHGVWHIMVLIGAALHFVFVARFVV